jgi:hypothetical protein
MKPVLDHDAFVSKADEELNKIVIPKVEFRETTLGDAVDYINKMIVSHNARPEAFQIPLLRFHLEMAGEPSPVPALPPGMSPGANAEPPSGGKTVSPYDATITLSLSNVSMKELIRYLTSLGGLQPHIQADAIWLRPISTGGISVLLKRVYLVPASVFSTKAEAEKFLKPIIPQFDSPDFFWSFDEKSRLLTLQFANPTIEEFEEVYAHALLKHGY